jgi:hypothetical protein
MLDNALDDEKAFRGYPGIYDFVKQADRRRLADEQLRTSSQRLGLEMDRDN